MSEVSKKTVIFLMISLFVCNCNHSYKKENVLSVVEKGNLNFTVRITAYREERNLMQVLAGVEYVIQVKAKEELDWRQIMVVYHDDGVEFDERNITFPNPQTAFVYLSNKYTVSLDAGENWTNLKVQACVIDTVEIENDGKGALLLNCGNGEKEKRLSTEDYGINVKPIIPRLDTGTKL